MKYLLLIVAIIVSVDVRAQELPEKQLSKIKVNEVNLRVGFQVMTDNQRSDFNYDEFKKIAPESKLYKEDINNMIKNEYTWYNSMGSTDIGLAMAFQFLNKEGTNYRQNPLLRIGINYTTRYNSFDFVRFNDTISTDILLTNDPTKTYRLDQIEERIYVRELIYKHLEFDAAIIYRSKQDVRISVYTGMGFNLGLPIRAEVNVDTWNDNYNTITDNNSLNIWRKYNDTALDNNKGEKFDIQKIISKSIYLPFGISSKISKKHPFWNKTELFVECRGTLHFVSVPELNQTNVYRGLYRSLGLRMIL